MRASEMAKALGITLWTPVYHKGKGVAMKQTDDGHYIEAGEIRELLIAALDSSQPQQQPEDLRRRARELRVIDDEGSADALDAQADALESQQHGEVEKDAGRCAFPDCVCDMRDHHCPRFQHHVPTKGEGR